MSEKPLVKLKPQVVNDLTGTFYKRNGNVQCVYWMTKRVVLLPVESLVAFFLLSQIVCIQCSYFKICVALGTLNFIKSFHTIISL